MARKVEQFTVGGETYECTALTYRKGFEIYNRLSKVFIPALRSVVSSATLGDRDAVAIDLVLGTLESMPIELATDLVNEFLPTCRVQRAGLWIQLNETLAEELFSARYPQMMQWLFGCLRVNYADFLAGLSGGVSGAGQSQKTQ